MMDMAAEELTADINDSMLKISKMILITKPLSHCFPAQRDVALWHRKAGANPLKVKKNHAVSSELIVYGKIF